MNELIINTKENELLSRPGIPFSIDYPELHTSVYVTLHLEGTMSYNVLEDTLYSAVDTGVLRSDVCSALAIAVSEAETQIGHPSKIPDHAEELSASIHARLAKRWAELYGAEPGALTITGISIPPDDRAMMERMDKAAEFAGKTPEEQSSLMAETLRKAQEAALHRIRPQTETWICTCGASNKGNYCTDCGKMRVWACECGTLNADNFCTNCGKPRI